MYNGMYNHKEYQKEWRESHKAQKKKWDEDNRWKYKGRQRAYILFQKYGITMDGYNELFAKQKGCCAICGRHQSDFKRCFAVDHDHETNVVRGLLCHHCNIAIGHFFEDIDTLKKAVMYLKKSSI